MSFLGYLASACAGYFLGAIPTGCVVGRLRGVDIRAVGSGNIGATNVFRTLGPVAGVLVLAFDAFKGYLACFVAGQWIAQALDTAGAGPAPTRESLAIVAGVAAILGHNYTFWLRFKGGKGIATSAGVLISWTPLPLLVCLAIWLVVLAWSRYVSLASMAAALCLPLVVALLKGSPLLIATTTALGSMAILKHRANILRLCQGTEHRLGAKPPAPNLPVSK